MNILVGIGLFLVALGWVLFGVNRRAFAWSSPAPAPDERRGDATRSTVYIPARSGERIEGWLYHPGGAACPVVLMAPGLAGTKEGPLERFAWGFAEAGFAVLSFDFRSFGGSEGAPRHNIDLRAQVADYEDVISHIRAGRVAGVDPARIALWGTSFSGASSICASVQTPVEAIVLNVPYLGRPGSKPGIVQMAGYFTLVLAEMTGDAIARLLGVRLDPVYITAYCLPGERAFAPSRDCPSRSTGMSPHPFWALLPEAYRGGWSNRFLVRGLQHLDAIDPAKALAETPAPVLVVAAVKDDMIRIEDTQDICSAAKGARLIQIDAGHFDPYVDPYFGPNLATQIAFLREALGMDAQKAAAI